MAVCGGSAGSMCLAERRKESMVVEVGRGCSAEEQGMWASTFAVSVPVLSALFPRAQEPQQSSRRCLRTQGRGCISCARFLSSASSCCAGARSQGPPRSRVCAHM